MPQVNIFSVAMALKRKKVGKPAPLTLRAETRGGRNWMKALTLAVGPRKDPWANFELNELPVENAKRHKYNAVTKQWIQEDVVVKIDREAFDKGAMRECFRM